MSETVSVSSEPMQLHLIVNEDGIEQALFDPGRVFHVTAIQPNGSRTTTLHESTLTQAFVDDINRSCVEAVDQPLFVSWEDVDLSSLYERERFGNRTVTFFRRLGKHMLGRAA